MRKLLLIAALSVPMLLPACSGKPAPVPVDPAPANGHETTPTAEAPTSPSPKTYTDVCNTLLTKEEAEVIARTPLNPGIEGPPHQPGCMYTGPTDGPNAQVEIYLGDGAKKFLDIDRDVLKKEFTEVPGIADEAVEEENTIFFRHGTTWVVIHLVRLNDAAENRDVLREAAAKVGSRM